MDQYTPLITILAPTLAALAAVIVMSQALLKGWLALMALRSRELEQTSAHSPTTPAQNAGARIEIADLKERVRQLEAIAAGVEL